MYAQEAGVCHRTGRPREGPAAGGVFTAPLDGRGMPAKYFVSSLALTIWFSYCIKILG